VCVCVPRGSGSEAGSYLRLIDSCIIQLKGQGPSRTCNESKEEVFLAVVRAQHKSVFGPPTDVEGCLLLLYYSLA